MENIHATLPCLHITGAWKEDAWALGTRPSKSQPRSQDLYPGLGVAWGHGVAWGCGGKRENLRTALTWGTTDKELLTSSNQRLWECVRCRINLYPDTLNDFPSWLSTSKNQPCFINNRCFTERYFSDKVHASLIDWWLRCVTAPVSVDSNV